MGSITPVSNLDAPIRKSEVRLLSMGLNEEQVDALRRFRPVLRDHDADLARVVELARVHMEDELRGDTRKLAPLTPGVSHQYQSVATYLLKIDAPVNPEDIVNDALIVATLFAHDTPEDTIRRHERTLAELKASEEGYTLDDMPSIDRAAMFPTQIDRVNRMQAYINDMDVALTELLKEALGKGHLSIQLSRYIAGLMHRVDKLQTERHSTEFLRDPQTNLPVKDSNGNPVAVYPRHVASLTRHTSYRDIAADESVIHGTIVTKLFERAQSTANLSVAPQPYFGDDGNQVVEELQFGALHEKVAKLEDALLEDPSGDLYGRFSQGYRSRHAQQQRTLESKGVKIMTGANRLENLMKNMLVITAATRWARDLARNAPDTLTEWQWKTLRTAIHHLAVESAYQSVWEQMERVAYHGVSPAYAGKQRASTQEYFDLPESRMRIDKGGDTLASMHNGFLARNLGFLNKTGERKERASDHQGQFDDAVRFEFVFDLYAQNNLLEPADWVVIEGDLT